MIALAEQVTTSARGDKEQIWVLAIASDAMGRQVHGYYTSWTLDGAAQTDGTNVVPGDLYRYRFQPGGLPRALAASRGPQMATSRITAYDGSVANTTYLGCAVVPGRL